RLPKAQPPAKAAPNTSAEIRIAAESTVEMLIQLRRLGPRGVPVASSMGGNEYQRRGRIKCGLPGRRDALHCGERWRFRLDGRADRRKSVACRLGCAVRRAAA